RPPAFFTRVFIKADNQRLRSTHEGDQLLPLYQRRGRHAPHGQLGPEVAGEMPAPEDIAVAGVEAEHVSHGTDGIDTLAVDDRCRPRPVRIADRVRALVSVLPEDFSGPGIQAEDAFLPALAGLGKPVGDEDSYGRDGAARVTV